jgi:acetamidase/formamidase
MGTVDHVWRVRESRDAVHVAIVMGIAPGEDGKFRTRPPGVFGGNMDVRELCAGAKLYLPVLSARALFSAGDVHAAQGDGEVCVNGTECPADVRLRFRLHRNRALQGPLIEASATKHADAADGSWIVIESGTNAVAAARAATSRMIDLLAEYWGFPPEHAYLLCSIAMKLQLSQVVNGPMFTIAAVILKRILLQRKLF